METMPTFREFQKMDRETKCTIMYSCAADFKSHEREQNGQIRQIKLMIYALLVMTFIGNHETWMDIFRVALKILG